MKNAFGEFIREKRLVLGLSMRSLAKEVGMQPSNYCNVENGVLPPPSAEGVERIAVALRLEPASNEHVKLLDLAAEARSEVPADIARIVRENTLIPALLRTVESERVSEKKLRGIIEDLRHGRYKST